MIAAILKKRSSEIEMRSSGDRAHLGRLRSDRLHLLRQRRRPSLRRVQLLPLTICLLARLAQLGLRLVV